MSSNRQSQGQRGQLPGHRGSAQQAAAAGCKLQRCHDRLAKIVSMIDTVGEKKQAQVDVVYGETCKGTLDRARDTLKNCESVLDKVKKQPGESKRNHASRLKDENMTEQEYHRSVVT